MGSGKKYPPVARTFEINLFEPEASDLATVEQNEIDWAAARKNKADPADLRRRIFCVGLRIFLERPEK